MSEINPACAAMTADCPPGNDCRLTAEDCWIDAATENAPAASAYRYRCQTCDKTWTVRFPQQNPVFDRTGQRVDGPVPSVTAD